jgi:hypothetical protein
MSRYFHVGQQVSLPMNMSRVRASFKSKSDDVLPIVIGRLGGQTADKALEVGATGKFTAIGTLVSSDSTPAPTLALQEQQATLKLYLNGKVEQFWLREDGKGVIFLMAASTRAEVAELVQKLPYSQAGAIRFDLIPVGPMMPFIWLLDDGLVHGP